MLKQGAYRADDIIGLVPDKLLDDLAFETGVDFSAKKLFGKTIFKLYLYAFLNGRQISQRILEAIFASKRFREFFETRTRPVKYSAISMRLKNVSFRYFERIFEHLVASTEIEEVILSQRKIKIWKIDSTMVCLSSKLLKLGLESPAGWRAVKYAVRLHGGLPVEVRLFTGQKAANDGNVFPELIERGAASRSLSIAIFDRGVQDGAFLLGLARKNIYFITRLSRQSYEVMEERPLAGDESPALKIVSDQLISFTKFKRSGEPLRLIGGLSKTGGQRVYFLTNVTFLSALEITELYRSRWEIETFFRFIKQELCFGHLLSRSENGIKVVMYLTMIAAILLTLYKRRNNILGWAVAKIKFIDELESGIINEWYQEIRPAFEKSKPKNDLDSS